MKTDFCILEGSQGVGLGGSDGFGGSEGFDHLVAVKSGGKFVSFLLSLGRETLSSPSRIE